MSNYTEKQLAYIKELKTVDWWACMSDDGGVARRGAAHEATVARKGNADPETKGMYEKYRAYIWDHSKQTPNPFADAE